MKNFIASLSLLTAFLFLSACANQAGATKKTTHLGKVPPPVIAEYQNIPVAKPDPLGRKNMFISPYKPYNIIDCKGYHSGEVVGDPSTAQRDAKGKVIESSSKHFLIP